MAIFLKLYIAQAGFYQWKLAEYNLRLPSESFCKKTKDIRQQYTFPPFLSHFSLPSLPDISLPILLFLIPFYFPLRRHSLFFLYIPFYFNISSLSIFPFFFSLSISLYFFSLSISLYIEIEREKNQREIEREKEKRQIDRQIDKLRERYGERDCESESFRGRDLEREFQREIDLEREIERDRELERD